MKSKLDMAHEWYMKHSVYPSFMDADIARAWKYADAMQAESNKRNQDARSLTKDKNGNCLHLHHEFGHKKCMDCGASLEEWQPDWSVAPDGFNWWAMDGDNHCHWFKYKPRIVNENNEFDVGYRCTTCDDQFRSALSFNYQGDWKDSLRKRPSEV